MGATMLPGPPHRKGRGARAPGSAAGGDRDECEAQRALPRGPRAETAIEVRDVLVPELAQEAGRGVPALARGAAHDDAARGDLGVLCTELVEREVHRAGEGLGRD